MKRKIHAWLIRLLQIGLDDHLGIAKAKLVIYLPVGYGLITLSSVPLMIYYGAWHLLVFTFLALSLLLATPLVLKWTRSTHKASLFFAIANLISTTISFIQMGSSIDFLAAPYYIIHIVIVSFLLSKRVTIFFAILDVCIVTVLYALRQFDIYHQNAIVATTNNQWALLFNFILMVGVLAYILIRYIDVRAAIINQVKLKNNALNVRQDEVKTANALLNEKNKDLTDNLMYAQRIQNALMDEESYVSKHLPEHFVFFHPKDIVSGDFYWNYQKDNTWYVAAADCTGHGVSGAFLSLLGISYLNEIIKENPDIKPSDVLERLRTQFIHVLGNREELIYSLDGMDIALIKVNLDTLELEYSGAYNPLYHVRDGQLTETKATKSTIGHSIAMYPYQNHNVQLEKGDLIYVFSDGFADQFGGDLGRKYSYKRLRNFIGSVCQKPLERQKIRFHKEFLNWKGGHEQLDDICILGIKF